MDKIHKIASSCPFIKNLSTRTGINPSYIAIGFCALIVFITQATPIGLILSNIISLLLVIRSTLLNLHTIPQKVSELRKNNIVLCLLLMSIVLEMTGLYHIIPLFSIVKIFGIMWANANEKNAEMIYSYIFNLIPKEYLESGFEIENAVKITAKKLESEINKISVEKKHE